MARRLQYRIYGRKKTERVEFSLDLLHFEDPLLFPPRQYLQIGRWNQQGHLPPEIEVNMLRVRVYALSISATPFYVDLFPHNNYREEVQFRFSDVSKIEIMSDSIIYYNGQLIVFQNKEPDYGEGNANPLGYYHRFDFEVEI